jgi:hypothetical protein
MGGQVVNSSRWINNVPLRCLMILYRQFTQTHELATCF